MRHPFHILRRVDWLLALGLTAFSAVLVTIGTIPSPSPLLMVAGWLASPYYTGAFLAILWAWGEAVVRLLPAARRWPVRLVGAAGVVVLSWWFFVTLPRPEIDLWVNRVYLTTALGAAIMVPATLLYLATSGALPIRKIAAATAKVLVVFGPFLLFIANAFSGLTLLSEQHPAVLDLTVLRMDESLGFHAPLWFWSLGYFGTWFWDAQFLAYQGISAFVLGVAAALYFAQDQFGLRRCLLAYVLTGLLGWACYAAFPVVGPSLGVPELFKPQADRALVEHTLLREGPLEVAPEHNRNGVPSLHTAWALLALAAAWGHRRRLFHVCLPMGFLSIITTLSLCMHYTADLIASIPLVAFVWWISDRLVRRFDNACAPELLLPPAQRRPLTIALLVLLVASVLGWFYWAQAAPLAPWQVWPPVIATGGTLLWLGYRLNLVARARAS